MKEPTSKRTALFVDGQNLFYSVKESFGYPYPNYHIRKLAEKVCHDQGWRLTAIRFYTGIPDPTIDRARHHFWVAKLAAMGTRGILTYSRPMRYSNQLVPLPDGSFTTTLVGREKGIDIRLALDVVRGALHNEYDVAVIFSQDQDLTEVADEVRQIARQQNRWIKLACAFPISPTSRNKRGIDGTDWIRIDRTTYDCCIDSTEFRGKKT